jgi:hypothetical protein
MLHGIVVNIVTYGSIGRSSCNAGVLLRVQTNNALNTARF